MKTLRLVITLILVVLLAVLSLFQMQIRGYTKIARINPQAVLYQNSEVCNQESTIIYENNEFTYYLVCSDTYIIKSGFQERSIKDALDLEVITVSELENELNIEQVEKE